MNKRIPREFVHDLGKYIVIAAFLIMLISLLSGFLVAGSSMKKSYDDSFVTYNTEDGHFTLSAPLSDEAIENISEKCDLKIARDDYFDEKISDNKTLRVYTLPDTYNLPCVMEGELPLNDHAIALDRMFCDNNSIKIGETVTMNGKDYEITGFIALPNYSALFENNSDLMFDANNFGVALVTDEGAERADSAHTRCNYVIKYNTPWADLPEASKRSEDFLAALKDELTEINLRIYQNNALTSSNDPLCTVYDYVPRFESKAINFAGEDLEGDTAAFTLFGYLVMALLAFIVAVISAGTITQEAPVIGTLRANGYTRGELLRHYMILPSIVFIAGALIGNILGYTVLLDFMSGLYYSSYSLPTFEVIWNTQAFIDTTIIPLVIMFAINFLTVFWKLRTDALSFLRRELSRRKKKRTLPLSARIPFKSRFRIRIILQNIPNYFMMVLGVIIAAAVMIFGMMFIPMFDAYEKNIANTLFADHQYILTKEFECDDEDAEKFAVSYLETTYEDFKTDSVAVYGIVPGSKYIKTSIPSGKAVVSSSITDKYGIKDGETLPLYDKYNDKDYSVTVEGSYEFTGSLAIFIDIDDYRRLFSKDDSYFSGYLSNKALGSIPDDIIYADITRTDYEKTSRQLRTSFGDMMAPVSLFGAIMFVLVVYLLSKQIIERNASSISMSKILGFSSNEIGGLYVTATTIVAVVSLFLAIPCVSALLRFVFTNYLYKRIAGYFPLTIAPDCYIKMIVLGIVSYSLVALLEFKKIGRIPKSIALRSAE